MLGHTASGCQGESAIPTTFDCALVDIFEAIKYIKITAFKKRKTFFHCYTILIKHYLPK